MQPQRNGRDQPQALYVGRIDSIANAVLKEEEYILKWNSIIRTILSTYPGTGHTLLPGAHSRVPHKVEHLMVIVDVEALVRDRKRKGNGRMGFSHTGSTNRAVLEESAANRDKIRLI